MNRTDVCSKNDSFAPIYLWKWSPTFFDLEVSHTFLDKAFKIISLIFFPMEKTTDFYQETISVIIHFMSKDMGKIIFTKD